MTTPHHLHKMSKQELKEPDQISRILAEITRFAMENRRQVMMAGIAALIVAAGLTGWYFYRQHNESKALALYAKASETYVSMRLTGQNTLAAVPALEEVPKAYPGTRSAAFAAYRLGSIHLAHGQVDQAIQAYSTYLDAVSDDHEFRSLVLSGLGYCYEAKKDYKKSLSYFEQAAAGRGGKSFESITYANLARIHEALADKTKALEFYRKAAEKTKEANMKDLLNRKIASLA